MTHKSPFPAVAILLAVAFGQPGARAAEVAAYFSPHGGATAAAVAAIDSATTSVDVLAYQLTSPPLIAALARAGARGVAVRIALDRSNEGPPAKLLSRLPAAGPVLRTDAFEKLQHNKTAVIDGTTVLTGSFNWSANAENGNAENLIIIRDPATAAAFAAAFTDHWAHSRNFSPRPPTPTRANPRPATFHQPRTRP